MQYEHIRQLPTDLVDGLLQLSDEDLLRLLQLEEVPSLNFKIQSILQKVKELSIFENVPFQSESGSVTATQHELRGMNPKKIHEVKEICPRIDSLWKDNKLDTIVDIGAGQGYISQVSFINRIDFTFCSFSLLIIITLFSASKRRSPSSIR